MNCQEFQDRLHHLLDGDPVPDRPAFERHRETCPECGEWFAAAAAMIRGVRLLPVPPAAESLPSRAVEQLLDDHRALRRSRSRLRWGMAAAACIGLLLVAGFMTRSRTESPAEFRSPSTERAKSPSTAADLPGQHGRPVVSLNQSLAEARSALTSLASQTAEEAVAPGRLLIPEKVEPPLTVVSVDVWQQALETTPQALREAGQGVTAGLEPMTDSARRAVNVFLQEIPSLGEVR